MTGKASGLTTHGLSMLRRVGGWMAIHPEKTYVASSIRGLGPCRSTYVAPTRRALNERSDGHRLHASLVVASIAALALLSACATHRSSDRSTAACAAVIADCQKDAAPVSRGAPNRVLLTSVAITAPAGGANRETRPQTNGSAPAAVGHRTALD